MWNKENDGNLLTSPSQIQYFETQRVEVLHLNSVALSHSFPRTTLGSIAMTISANKIEAYILYKGSTTSSIQLKNTQNHEQKQNNLLDAMSFFIWMIEMNSDVWKFSLRIQYFFFSYCKYLSSSFGNVH